MVRVSDIGLVADSFFVGVRRIEDEFLDGTIARKVYRIAEQLYFRQFTSLEDVSGGSAFTKTRLSCNTLTF